MIRLYRNNLFLKNCLHKWKKDGNEKCWVSSTYTETRFHIFKTCEKTNTILQFLITVFKKSGYLENCNSIKLFLFGNYRSDSIENVSLMFLWKFIHTKKLMNGNPNSKAFAYAYRGLVAVVTEMGLVQILGGAEILRILNDEQRI